MKDELANPSLVDGEEDAIQEEAAAVESISQFCLRDLYYGYRGKRYLFQFFHEVDIARVLVGTPWFFNNHMFILQRIRYGENPAVLVLNFTEFWIQVHELPPGLMSESMAKQLGNFCGKFLEYDTVIPFLGQKTYMRIRVCFDVSAPLKHKKKIQIGKAMIVYARFKYEKLSQFYFICGKLGHGESYYPFRLRIEPSKINIAGGQNNWRTWGKDVSVTDGLGKGPMDLALEEENDPITMVERKKR
ncbi:hypothetical protein Gotri_005936 [Gossypium trilobum]|uniref:DUF4283 domain-containing protein n=1 Tax=Gossypium trilobum TaxID=34281 RepID=A0A7J9EY97_9ROSI|nr:hypothetical protein [Gossypium trilobum]